MTKSQKRNSKITIKGALKNAIIVVGSKNAINAGPSQLPYAETLQPVVVSNQLPPGSRMPLYRNEIFKDREEDLIKLAKILMPTDEFATRAVAVTGMGGIGKTQLAVQFCYKFGSKFDGVHWINARESGDAEIAACGREMGLADSSNQTTEQVKQMTLRTWQEQPKRLVVLDNIEEPGFLSEWLPRLNGLSILITSLRSIWGPDMGMYIHPLEPLPYLDSLSLLRELAPQTLEHTSDDKLRRVGDRLGNLPLALDLAGRYFNGKPTLTPNRYLILLDQAGNALQHPSLLNWVDDGSPTRHDTNLIATFLVSWEQLDEDNDGLARRLFISASYLAANVSISHSIFCAITGEDEDGETDNTDKAILRLQKIGLLSVKKSIHGLLAEFGRMQDTDYHMLHELVRRMETFFDQEMRPFFEELDQQSKKNPVLLPRWIAPLSQHIKSLANKADQTKRSDARQLWRLLSQYYQMVSEYPAIAAQKRAIEIELEINRENSPNLANLYVELGNAFEEFGDFDNAQDCNKQAKLIWENLFGVDHPGYAVIVQNLERIQRGLDGHF